VQNFLLLIASVTASRHRGPGGAENVKENRGNPSYFLNKKSRRYKECVQRIDENSSAADPERNDQKKEGTEAMMS